MTEIDMFPLGTLNNQVLDFMHFTQKDAFFSILSQAPASPFVQPDNLARAGVV